MSSNADKLKALRYTLGLTQSQLAEKIGVSESSIALCERGYTSHGKVKAPAQLRIGAFLEVQDINPNIIAESKLVLELEERQKTLHKHFDEGKCYRIYGKSSQNKTSSLEDGYVFKFLCKQGIHHVFREIRGGWTRTYTDAQLIGKKIQEVSAN